MVTIVSNQDESGDLVHLTVNAALEDEGFSDAEEVSGLAMALRERLERLPDQALDEVIAILERDHGE